MKRGKFFFGLLFFCFSVLVNLTSVRADATYDSVLDSVSTGEGLLLCEYASSSSNDSVKIFYEFANSNIICNYPSDINSIEGCSTYSIFLKTANNKDKYNAFPNARLKFDYVFKNDQIVFTNNVSGLIKSERNFRCPEYVVADTDGKNELCFFDFGNTCDSKYDRNIMTLVYNGESFVEKMVDIATNRIKFMDVNDLIEVNNVDELYHVIWEATYEKLLEVYKVNNAPYVTPAFFSDRVSHIEEYYDHSFVEAFELFHSKVDRQISEGRVSSSKVADSITKTLDEYSAKLKTLVDTNGSASGSDKNNDENKMPDFFDNNCRDLAKSLRTGGFILLIVKILLPLIIIVKATMNFISVINKGSSDELKNNFKKLFRNILAALVVFLVPTFINIIFTFFSKYNENITDDSLICSECVFHPMGNVCTNAVSDSQNNE